MIGYLIDMDGVIYRGGHLIPGADRFIIGLRKNGIPFRFLTNNSQRTRRDVATRLQRMGIDVEEEHVYTCAMATARFLAHQKPGGTAFVIGEGGLLTALHENGYAIVDQDPDYVVVGEGRTISFELVEAALKMILGGAKLVATNLDPNCPTESGLRPGCGATVAMLETAGRDQGVQRGQAQPGHAAQRPQGTGTDHRRDDRHRRHHGNRHPRRGATRIQDDPGLERGHEPGRPGPLSPTDPTRSSIRSQTSIPRM